MQRPSPEYGQALDLAFVRLNGSSGRMLAVLSAPAHAAELLKRCPRPIDIVSTGRFDAHSFISDAVGWTWGSIGAASLHDTGAVYSTMVWMEPERPSAAAIAALLRTKAADGADLEVITSSALRRLLPAGQTPPVPALQPLPPGATQRCLRAAGWRIDAVTAFHGPRSFMWSRLARFSAAIGRPDWEDRCLFAMRACYREEGWVWRLAPLALIRARRA